MCAAGTPTTAELQPSRALRCCPFVTLKCHPYVLWSASLLIDGVHWFCLPCSDKYFKVMY